MNFYLKVGRQKHSDAEKKIKKKWSAGREALGHKIKSSGVIGAWRVEMKHKNKNMKLRRMPREP